LVNLSEKQLRDKLQNIEAFVLDQDGTLYLEYQPFSWTVDFLEGLQKRGIRYLFLSNNSSKSNREHINKLAGLGIKAAPEQILSSGEATIEYLQSQDNWQDIYLLATPLVEKDFENAGFNIDAEKPNYVVLAYDLTCTFDKLDKASRYVRRGVPFIATHADNNWMIGPDDYRPDVGALAAAVTASTKIEAKFIGKPNIEMINAFLRRLGLSKDKVAIVGDRLDTDIRMGYENDILNFLVLSGKTKKEELKDSVYQPSFVVEKTIDILNYF
jgi:NagD protein